MNGGTAIGPRLGLMMFLQYFAWGSWFVTLGTFLAGTLGSSGAQIGQAYSTQAWGAMLAPLAIGVIADRWFRAERLLALLNLVGAGLMLALTRSEGFAGFFPILLAYMLLFMPTLALANGIAFRHLPDAVRRFPRVRVWGTIGWIVAGLAISFVFAWDAPAAVADGALRGTFYLAAGASLTLAVYSLTLPATPPPRNAGNPLQALSMLRDKDFLAFVVASVLICIPLAFYYQHANQFLVELNVSDATAKQSLGQVSETLFMLVLPLLLHRFGIKATLLIGMTAWATRYGLFAFGQTQGWALLVGIALHGVCYDFFFVTGQIYTERKAAPGTEIAAQGLITFATYGIGMAIGFAVAGAIVDAFALPAGHDWRSIWLFPAAFALVVAIGFLVAFRGKGADAA
jgi:nucleoside transporter